MKRYILIVALFLGIAFQGWSQDDDKGGGRIEALKIAYLTKKLNLTPEEAQRFWPVYNKYADDVRQAQIDARKNKDPEIVREEKLLNIRKRYNDQFAKALSVDRANSFFRVEREFNGGIQKELMERRQNRTDRGRIRQ
ncbi:MAG: hypothetical protein H7Y31_04045 [Chitinophagaceae bacterium]|nr:hypothetical protein [Chitinophagaceae bacterium]